MITLEPVQRAVVTWLWTRHSSSAEWRCTYPLRELGSEWYRRAAQVSGPCQQWAGELAGSLYSL